MNRLKNFFAYNPDDIVNRRLLTTILKKSLLETPEKNESTFSYKIGGSGLVYSSLFSSANIESEIIPIVSEKIETLSSEDLSELSFSEAYYITNKPIMREIELSSKNISRRFYHRIPIQDFEVKGYGLERISYQDKSLFLTTCLHPKFINLFNEVSKNSLISTLIINRDSKSYIEEISEKLEKKFDISFVLIKKQLKDRQLEFKSLIKEFEKNIHPLSIIRIYITPENEIFIKTDSDNEKELSKDLLTKKLALKNKNIRKNLNVDKFIAGFLARLLEQVGCKKRLEKYFSEQDFQTLQEIFNHTLGMETT